MNNHFVTIWFWETVVTSKLISYDSEAQSYVVVQEKHTPDQDCLLLYL